MIAEQKKSGKETAEKLVLPVSVAPPVPPKSAIVVPPEIVGKQVKHKAYGEGTINGVTDIIIVVSFNSVGEKKLGYEVCIKNKLIEFI